jgi:YggT family protein
VKEGLSMVAILIVLINTVVNILSVLIVLDTILSYLLREDNPIRRFIWKLVNPMYSPIRRVVPPLGGIDFTPFIAIILLWVIDSLLVSLLRLVA